MLFHGSNSRTLAPTYYLLQKGMNFLMSAFVLKIIAMFSMFSDHLGWYLTNGQISYYNYIGRIAFPIFAFQISEGYIHTSNFKKYLSRLFIFAIISQIPFMLFMKIIIHDSSITLNIFFTLFLGLLCIFTYDKSSSKTLAIILITIICYLGELLSVDYGYWGILLIFFFYLFKDNKVLMSFIFLFMCLLKYGIPIIVNGFNIIYIILIIFTFLAIIPILLYNGKLGRKTKKLLYVFYPAHLLLIVTLKEILEIAVSNVT